MEETMEVDNKTYKIPIGPKSLTVEAKLHLYDNTSCLWQETKELAENQNIAFTLTEVEINEVYKAQEGKCAITKRLIFLPEDETQPCNVVVGRIDLQQGYVKQNIRLIDRKVALLNGNLSDQELETLCLDIIEGLQNKERPIPNFSSVADVIDRLIVELMKLSFYEESKRSEQGKPNPDPVKIAIFDNSSRDACEYRSMLKNKLNELLHQIVVNRAYSPLKEIRTFSRPARGVEDILEDMINNNLSLKRELAETLEYSIRELNVK